MPTDSFGRCRAVNPAKHGHLDYRVEFNGVAPTHAEMVWMVSYLLLAEDRYVNGDGRYTLWHHFDRCLMAKTPAAIRELALDVQATVTDPSSTKRRVRVA